MDGIFFMPVEDFRIAFPDYTILEYADWKVTKLQIKAPGKFFKFKMSSAVDQDISLTVDYEHKRKLAPGCK